MYISYDDYLEYGGNIQDEAAFNLYEARAGALLNKITQGRLNGAADIPLEVKAVYPMLIDILADSKNDEAVSGFSNDGVSISYSSPETIESKFTRKAFEYLPDYLVYRGVD